MVCDPCVVSIWIILINGMPIGIGSFGYCDSNFINMFQEKDSIRSLLLVFGWFVGFDHSYANIDSSI